MSSAGSVLAFAAVALLALHCLTTPVAAATKEQWKSRTIYQLLTDRFARTDGVTAECADLRDYCGGNWAGVIQQLPYIQSMGFDAIWISPVPMNMPHMYHGYAAKDLTQISPEFGGDAGLRALIAAAHAVGIWVMVDVVANHMGIPPNLSESPAVNQNYDFSVLVPFNKAEHYHGCDGCSDKCWIDDWNNPTQVLMCQLAGLPDLDQSNTWVVQQLLAWLQKLLTTYGFDGIRIDTVPEVPCTFWQQFQATAKSLGVYAVGEASNGDVGYVAHYQSSESCLEAVLSYPMYYQLQSAFGAGQSLYALNNTLTTYAQLFEDVDVLGNFVDNHDTPRFLHTQPDVNMLRAAYTFSFMTPGIPIFYYGDEALYNGAMDPYSRDVLWTSGYKMTDQVSWVSLLVSYRKHAGIWQHPMRSSQVDAQFMAFYRGTSYVALCNTPSGTTTRLISLGQSPFSAGDTICNVYWATGPTADCIVVGSDGFFVHLMNGEPKIYDHNSTIQAFYAQAAENNHEWMQHLNARVQEQVHAQQQPRVALE